MTTNTTEKTRRIPIWVIVMQIILILIMLSQVYMYFFDHQLLEETGVTVQGAPMLNLVYEMGGRTLVMAIVSIYVLITRIPKQFLIVLIMNVFREGFETIIDPLYPVLNAPSSPMIDLWTHIIIVTIEILALITIYKKTRTIEA